MTKKQPGESLLRLAATQAGVITRSQLMPHDRHTKAMRRWAREWTTLAPGYYCIQEPTWLSWCWAGLLRAGACGVLSGAAAGHLYGFVTAEPKEITVFHQGKRPLGPMGDAAVRVGFRRAKRAGRLTPTRTSVEVALVDLARESDESTAIMAVTRALTKGLTTTSRVLSRLGSTQRVRHRRALEELCGEASGGVESVLEWRFLQRVIRAHRLPEPARQVSLLSGTRSDSVWEEFGLVAELDGRLGHEEPFREMARDNRLLRRGLSTLRYGWHDVEARACDVAEEVGAVLAARGWTGGWTQCRSCVRAHAGGDDSARPGLSSGRVLEGVIDADG